MLLVFAPSSLRSSVLFIFFFLLTLSGLAQTKVDSPASSSNVTAKIDELLVSCDDLSRDMETGFTTLQGHVQIVYKDQYFSADQVIVDQKNKKATLLGNVSVKNTMSEIGGDEVFLDYVNNQAHIRNGYLKSNNIYFVGSSIEQTGPNKFHVSDAEYTTCSNCAPTWSFSGSNIEAEMGGYAFLRNSFLKVYGVPVFWLPYLIVPLKNERQTGLLAPEFGSKRDRGLILSESLFIAISRSQDATITLKNYEIGGLKKQLEYRYVLSEKSFGEFNFSHMTDSLFISKARYMRFMSQDEKDKSYNRWSLKGYSQIDLANSQFLNININQMSDIQYPQDFPDEFPNYSDSGLENRLTYTKNYIHTSLNANAIYYRHLLAADPRGNNSMAVHKLPELNFNTTLKKIENTPIYYKFDLDYSNFHREKKYDDVSWNGQLRYATNTTGNPACEKDPLAPSCYIINDDFYDDTKDLMRTGQRLMYKGALTTPAYNISNTLTLTPEISYNESHYLFPVGDRQYAAKKYIELDLLTRTKLYRIFDTEQNLKYRHEFIPELNYRWIPWINENQNPFFGLSSTDTNPVVSKVIQSDDSLENGNGVQFDYRDRIYDRHLITLTLLNRVVKKELDKYSNVFDLQIKQSYDLHQAMYGQNRNQPLSDLSSLMNLYLNDFTLNNQTNYYPYQSATNHSTSLTYKNAFGQYFRIGYISKQTDGPQQQDASFAIGFVSTYINLLTGIVIDTSEGRSSDSRLKKLSMITQFKPPGECWAINFYRDQKVGLEAEWTIRFDFSFDGKPTKVIPPDELNIN